MKKILFLLVLLFSTTSCSCSSTPKISWTPTVVDFKQKPKDFVCEYWLFDNVDYDSIDKSLIIYEYENKFNFVDSKYANDLSSNEKTSFNAVKVDDKWTINGVYTDDPTICMYGLSLKTSEDDVSSFMEKNGFEYFDKFYGRNPCYMKENYNFEFSSYGMNLYYDFSK